MTSGGYADDELSRGSCVEVADRLFIGTPGAGVAEIGEPLDFRRHLRQAMKLGGSQQPDGGTDFCRGCLLIPASA